MKLGEHENETNGTSDTVCESANSMTCFHLRPGKILDRSIEAAINAEEFVNEVVQLDGVSEALNELHAKTVSNNLIDRSSQYPKIIFLGTGSCIPNKTRNVSAILVHTK